MNDIQKKLLEMLKWLHNFMVDNNIDYYVAGGTMLGAVRHRGFIPWDDDIDIIVPRKDYEKLCRLLHNQIEHYIIESPQYCSHDYIYPFAKFYDINTTLIENNKSKIKRGLYIDIFPIDGIGNSIKESYNNYKIIDLYNMYLAAKICTYRKERKIWKNFLAFCGTILPGNNNKIAKKIDYLCSRKKYKDYIYVGNLMGTYRKKEIMNKRILGTPIKYKFEDMEVFGPEHYNEYLTITYGNWNQFPPINMRKSNHNYLEVNLQKSYLS